MKVLLTVTGSWGTGSFQVAKGVANALIAQGHVVKIFFPDSRVESSDLDYYYSHPERYDIWRFPLEKNGVCLNTFPLMLPDPNPRSPNAKTFNELSPAQWKLYFSALQNRLQQLLVDYQPDVIECQHIWVMDHVINNLKQPYICVAHNSDQLAYELAPSMQKLVKQAAVNAEYIFAVSDAVREKTIDLYGVDSEKVVTIPCGYDQRVFKPKEIDRGKTLKAFGLTIPDTAQLVCFSGKISRIKGIDILLEANGYLPSDHNIHFLIMGSGDINDGLIEGGMQYCLDRVHFLGHRVSEEVAQINNISDLSVVPSRSEGFCISGLEAIACGMPLVMTEAAHVGQYAAAAVVDSENPQQLAEAIVKILNLPPREYERLCKEALDSAQQFTWDCIVKKRLEYYEKMINAHRVTAENE